MAKKSKEQQPAVRKSFVIFGAITVAVAALAFVLVTFVGGGGGGGSSASKSPSSQTPATQAEDSSGNVQSGGPGEGLRPGGRNPFVRG